MTSRPYRWRRSLAAGAIIGTVQVVALVASIVLWRATGSWGAAAHVAYLVAFAVVVPAAGWLLAAYAVGGRLAPWHAWPVGLFSFLIVVSGHGFEDAGLPLWVPVAAMGAVSLFFGTLWFAERGWSRQS